MRIKHTQIDVLRRYSKPVVHMRAQRAARKLSIVFGAGISEDFNLPSWSKLVDRIAAHPTIQGKAIDRKNDSLTSRAEILYRHFEKRRREQELQRSKRKHLPPPESQTLAKSIKG